MDKEEQVTPDELENNGKGDSLKSWIITIVVAIVLAKLIQQFIFNTTLVFGQSMEPTLHERDRLVCLVTPLYFSGPERGDIVVVDSPLEDKEYIKRVIGVPGDKITILDGKVYVNDELTEESYIDSETETQVQVENTWTLEKDMYFVMGDNRHPGMSVDSRYFGPVSKDTIRSIAKFRFYPFEQIGSLS